MLHINKVPTFTQKESLMPTRKKINKMLKITPFANEFFIMNTNKPQY
jgi:hypothetical protein